MPSLDEMLKKANSMVKSPGKAPAKAPAKITAKAPAKQEPAPKEKAAKAEKPGASVVVAEEAHVFHRDASDSPTSLFTPESVEESALNGLQRLMNMWDARMPELERSFNSADEYVAEANRIFEQYRGLRIKIDSAVAYTIGDTLNHCRERFFKAGTLNGQTWTQFVQTRCRFSFRQAYDFMNIATRLGSLRGRKLSMEQFRAILHVTGLGLALDSLPGNLESLSPKEILKLGASLEAPQRKGGFGWHLGTMRPMVVRMGACASELQKILEQKNATGEKMTLSRSEKNQILSAQRQLREILSVFDKVISSET